MIWFMCIRCKMITISIILYSCNVLVCGENVKKNLIPTFEYTIQY